MDLHVPPPQDQARSPTITVFLALYLLVLAFFILMVSIASPEKVRSDAVMDSLTSTFASVLPPTTELTAFAAKEGDVVAGEVFQEEITGIFATLLRVARVEIVQPGRLMRVLVPTDSLFHLDDSALREGRSALLDRIVASISTRPAGLRFDMEAVIGTPYRAGEDIPVVDNLAMRRAGVLARTMLERGAPLDSVGIALKPETPNETALWFYVRTVEETRLRFERFEQAAEDALAP